MSGTIITEATKFVTFVLDEETFALDIGQVREVLEFTSVTKVPQMPAFVRGVINLRGNVVPVADLKQKFGMGETKKTVNARILITEVSVDGEATVIGALADGVHDVVELEPGEIGPAPKIGTRLSVDFIRGMGRKNENFIIILDIDRVFSMDELSVVQTLEDGPEKKEAAPLEVDLAADDAPEDEADPLSDLGSEDDLTFGDL